MIVAFASNFLNHHQLPLSLAFCNAPGVSFYFLAFTETPKDRLAMGYEDMNSKYSFVVKAYQSSEEKDRAISLIKTADVFISGFSDEHIRIRLAEGKRVYKFSERYFKTYGYKDLKHSALHFFLSAQKHIRPFSGKNLVYLAASAYLKTDLNRFLKCKNKVLKWGYFPEHIPFGQTSKPKNKELQLLWVGRFLKWKHPESAIRALASLKKQNIPCHLTMVGEGEEKKRTIELAKDLKVIDSISWISSLPFQEVREIMRNSDIFLFTSDESEGWGAVLNEAMDSRCAVVASIECGSVPFLIENGVNGYSYRWNDQQKLNSLVALLANNPGLRSEVQNNAYETISKLWNAETAAKRLLQYEAGQSFENGPCSLEYQSE